MKRKEQISEQMRKSHVYILKKEYHILNVVSLSHPITLFLAFGKEKHT